MHGSAEYMFKTIRILAFVLTVVACHAAEPKAVEITANDQMKFSVTALDATAGQELSVTLKNVGTIPKAAMGHNFVVLKPGTDVNAFAMAGMSHAEASYIAPEQADKVIVATKVLGPGETDTIKLKLDAGEYPFICTFPGHALAGMKGVITVK